MPIAKLIPYKSGIGCLNREHDNNKFSERLIACGAYIIGRVIQYATFFITNVEGGGEMCNTELIFRNKKTSGKVGVFIIHEIL